MRWIVAKRRLPPWGWGLLVLVGLALRLAPAPFTSWSPDLVPWLTRIQELQHGIPLYDHLDFSYPPLFGDLLALVGWPFIAHALPLGSSPAALRGLSISSGLLAGTIPTPALTLAFKLPAILADAGTALALAALARRIGLFGRDHLVAAAWLFNPLSIFISGVHGQFDALPVLMTVLALLLVIDEVWLFAGVAIALGILFKVYPIYLLPLFALAPLMGPHSIDIRRVAFAWLRMLAGLALPLLAFTLTLDRQQALTAVFSRSQTSSGLGGGLGLMFLGVLPPIAKAAAPFAGGIHSALTLLLGIGAAAILVGAWRGRGRGPVTLVLAAGSTLALLLLTTSTVNPQYVLWPLPFLILAGAASPRLRYAAVGLSAVPVLFYVAMWSGNWREFLVPAVTYYNWPVSPTALAASLRTSYLTVGPGGFSLSYVLMACVGAVAAALLLVAAIPSGLSGLGWPAAFHMFDERIARSRLRTATSRWSRP